MLLLFKLLLMRQLLLLLLLSPILLPLRSLHLSQFTRSTTKYWVHPSAVLRVKLHLLRHLPLLVYGAVDPTAAADMSSARALRRGATGTTSLVSSGAL
jgi:VTC domain